MSSGKPFSASSIGPLAPAPKGRIQAVNINSVFSGKSATPAVAQPPKSVHIKHGLQSLSGGTSGGGTGAGGTAGTKPTVVRRMPPPATLPSLKAECGQDPDVNLVPAGGAGWGGGPEGAPPSSGAPQMSVSQQQQQLKSNAASGPAPATATLRSTANGATLPAPIRVPPAELNRQPPGSIDPRLRQGWQAGQAAGSAFIASVQSREFPTLQAAQRHGEAAISMGPSLKPACYGSWKSGGGSVSQQQRSSVYSESDDRASNEGANGPAVGSYEQPDMEEDELQQYRQQQQSRSPMTPVDVGPPPSSRDGQSMGAPLPPAAYGAAGGGRPIPPLMPEFAHRQQDRDAYGPPAGAPPPSAQQTGYYGPPSMQNQRGPPAGPMSRDGGGGYYGPPPGPRADAGGRYRPPPPEGARYEQPPYRKAGDGYNGGAYGDQRRMAPPPYGSQDQRQMDWNGPRPPYPRGAPPREYLEDDNYVWSDEENDSYYQRPHAPAPNQRGSRNVQPRIDPNIMADPSRGPPPPPHPLQTQQQAYDEERTWDDERSGYEQQQLHSAREAASDHDDRSRSGDVRGPDLWQAQPGYTPWISTVPPPQQLPPPQSDTVRYDSILMPRTPGKTTKASKAKFASMANLRLNETEDSYGDYAVQNSTVHAAPERDELESKRRLEMQAQERQARAIEQLMLRQRRQMMMPLWANPPCGPGQIRYGAPDYDDRGRFGGIRPADQWQPQPRYAPPGAVPPSQQQQPQHARYDNYARPPTQGPTVRADPERDELEGRRRREMQAQERDAAIERSRQKRRMMMNAPPTNPQQSGDIAGGDYYGNRPPAVEDYYDQQTEERPSSRDSYGRNSASLARQQPKLPPRLQRQQEAATKQDENESKEIGHWGDTTRDSTRSDKGRHSKSTNKENRCRRTEEEKTPEYRLLKRPEKEEPSTPTEQAPAGNWDDEEDEIQLSNIKAKSTRKVVRRVGPSSSSDSTAGGRPQTTSAPSHGGKQQQNKSADTRQSTMTTGATSSGRDRKDESDKTKGGQKPTEPEIVEQQKNVWEQRKEEQRLSQEKDNGSSSSAIAVAPINEAAMPTPAEQHFDSNHKQSDFHPEPIEQLPPRTDSSAQRRNGPREFVNRAHRGALSGPMSVAGAPPSARGVSTVRGRGGGVSRGRGGAVGATSATVGGTNGERRLDRRRGRRNEDETEISAENTWGLGPDVQPFEKEAIEKDRQSSVSDVAEAAGEKDAVERNAKDTLSGNRGTKGGRVPSNRQHRNVYYGGNLGPPGQLDPRMTRNYYFPFAAPGAPRGGLRTGALPNHTAYGQIPQQRPVVSTRGGRATGTRSRGGGHDRLENRQQRGGRRPPRKEGDQWEGNGEERQEGEGETPTDAAQQEMHNNRKEPTANRQRPQRGTGGRSHRVVEGTGASSAKSPTASEGHDEWETASESSDVGDRTSRAKQPPKTTSNAVASDDHDRTLTATKRADTNGISRGGSAGQRYSNQRRGKTNERGGPNVNKGTANGNSADTAATVNGTIPKNVQPASHQRLSTAGNSSTTSGATTKRGGKRTSEQIAGAQSSFELKKTTDGLAGYDINNHAAVVVIDDQLGFPDGGGGGVSPQAEFPTGEFQEVVSKKEKRLRKEQESRLQLQMEKDREEKARKAAKSSSTSDSRRRQGRTGKSGSKRGAASSAADKAVVAPFFERQRAGVESTPTPPQTDTMSHISTWHNPPPSDNSTQHNKQASTDNSSAVGELPKPIGHKPSGRQNTVASPNIAPFGGAVPATFDVSSLISAVDATATKGLPSKTGVEIWGTPDPTPFSVSATTPPMEKSAMKHSKESNLSAEKPTTGESTDGKFDFIFDPTLVSSEQAQTAVPATTTVDTVDQLHHHHAIGRLGVQTHEDELNEKLSLIRGVWEQHPVDGARVDQDPSGIVSSAAASLVSHAVFGHHPTSADMGNSGIPPAFVGVEKSSLAEGPNVAKVRPQQLMQTSMPPPGSSPLDMSSALAAVVSQQQFGDAQKQMFAGGSGGFILQPFLAVAGSPPAYQPAPTFAMPPPPPRSTPFDFTQPPPGAPASIAAVWQQQPPAMQMSGTPSVDLFGSRFGAIMSSQPAAGQPMMFGGGPPQRPRAPPSAQTPFGMPPMQHPQYRIQDTTPPPPSLLQMSQPPPPLYGPIGSHRPTASTQPPPPSAPSLSGGNLFAPQQPPPNATTTTNPMFLQQAGSLLGMAPPTQQQQQKFGGLQNPFGPPHHQPSGFVSQPPQQHFQFSPTVMPPPPPVRSGSRPPSVPMMSARKGSTSSSVGGGAPPPRVPTPNGEKQRDGDLLQQIDRFINAADEEPKGSAANDESAQPSSKSEENGSNSSA